VQKDLARILAQFSAGESHVIEAAAGAAAATPLAAAQVPVAAEETIKELSPEELASFEALLKGGASEKTPSLDSFWESAGAKTLPPASADMLSFEQAKKLGLTPD
jgi:hypothetical protein